MCDELVKKVNAIQTTDTSNLVKKLTITQKTNEIEIKKINDHDHDRYIATEKFNKLTSENFAARLVQGNFENKNDIADFVKKDIFY